MPQNLRMLQGRRLPTTDAIQNESKRSSKSIEFSSLCSRAEDSRQKHQSGWVSCLGATPVDPSLSDYNCTFRFAQINDYRQNKTPDIFQISCRYRYRKYV
eukprot:3237633-Amphidinium_carterae.1